jgi:hypothetical protein
MKGIARIGNSQTSIGGIFLLTLSGRNVAAKLRMDPTRMVVAVQPYQVMFDPSPLRAASSSRRTRFVADGR